MYLNDPRAGFYDNGKRKSRFKFKERFKNNKIRRQASNIGKICKID